MSLGRGSRDHPETPPGGGAAAPRAAIRYCLERRHLRRTLAIALVAGCALTLINQLDVFLRGEATTATYIKSALNFCVPFVGSNLGLLAGRRTDVEAAVDEVRWPATDARGLRHDCGRRRGARPQLPAGRPARVAGGPARARSRAAASPSSPPVPAIVPFGGR